MGTDVYTEVARPGYYIPSEMEWSEVYEVQICVIEVIRGDDAREPILTNKHAQRIYIPFAASTTSYPASKSMSSNTYLMRNSSPAIGNIVTPVYFVTR